MADAANWDCFDQVTTYGGVEFCPFLKGGPAEFAGEATA